MSCSCARWRDAATKGGAICQLSGYAADNINAAVCRSPAFLRRSLPYSAETTSVLRIMSLAIFPEAVFSLGQALFTANERLEVPTLAAVVNSVIRLGLGIWLLYTGNGDLCCLGSFQSARRQVFSFFRWRCCAYFDESRKSHYQFASAGVSAEVNCVLRKDLSC